MRIKCLGTALAATLCLAPAAWAQIAPTPSGWEPGQAKAKTDAYVQRRIEVFNRKAPDSEIRAALKLAQMVRPDEPTVLSQLAYYLGTWGSDQEFLDILAFRPEDPLANFHLAGNLSEQGYVNLALPYYAKAAALRPNVSWVQYDAGMNAFYAEDDAACVANLTRALAIGLTEEERRQAYLKRGECHARAGQRKEAKADFGRASVQGAYSVRMLDDGAFGPCRGGSLDKRVRDAAAIADNWKTYEGYRDLTRVLQCDRRHIGALTERLKLEARDANLKRHAEVHQIQLRNLTDGGATDAARARALRQPTAAEMLAEGQAIDMTKPQADITRVAYLSSRVLMLEPDNREARLLRARAVTNLAIGPLAPLAWDDATRVLQANPRAAKAHLVRAILMIRGKGYGEAVTELTAAIALDPNDVRLYLYRSQANLQLARNDAAVRDLTRVLASTPKEVAVRIDRAAAHYKLKNHAAALDDLGVALSVDPNDFRVRASIIQVLDALGRRADADALHIMLLADKQAQAKADAYLTARTTPELTAKVAAVQRGQAVAAQEKRAKERFQAFIEEYSPGEYAFDNLVRKMSNIDQDTDGQKTVDDIRDTAKYADARLNAAWRLGSAFMESDDAAGLPEELLGKLAVYMLDVQEMQKAMTKIKAKLY